MAFKIRWSQLYSEADVHTSNWQEETNNILRRRGLASWAELQHHTKLNQLTPAVYCLAALRRKFEIKVTQASTLPAKAPQGRRCSTFLSQLRGAREVLACGGRHTPILTPVSPGQSCQCLVLPPRPNVPVYKGSGHPGLATPDLNLPGPPLSRPSPYD